VQVLVVVVLVGVLLALAPLAIQSAREAARKTACSNNLRSIALGLRSYHDTHNMFPMGSMHSGPNPGGDPPVTAALGPAWWFGILPFMDQRGGPKVRVSQGAKSMGNYLIDADKLMYDKIVESQRPGRDVRCEFCADDVIRYLDAHPYTVSDGQHVARLSIGMMVPPYMCCPCSPLPLSETVIGPITMPSYVGIAGGCDIDPTSQDYQISGRAPSGLVAPKAEHVYDNKYKGTGAAAGGIVTSSGLLPPCQHIRVRDCTDGASNTMIVAEQSDWLLDRDPAWTTKYHGDSGWTDGSTGPGGGWLSGTRRVDPVPQVNSPGDPPAIWGGDCWNITTVRYPPNLKRVIGTERSGATPLPGCSENHGINNPLQSPHPGGVWVAMASGSVQFIREDTDLEILLRLSIRDDGVSPPQP